MPVSPQAVGAISMAGVEAKLEQLVREVKKLGSPRAPNVNIQAERQCQRLGHRP